MADQAHPVSFRWPKALLDAIDEKRGDVPRSTWVQRVIERALNENADKATRQAPAPGLPKTAPLGQDRKVKPRPPVQQRKAK